MRSENPLVTAIAAQNPIGYNKVQHIKALRDLSLFIG